MIQKKYFKYFAYENQSKLLLPKIGISMMYLAKNYIGIMVESANYEQRL
jgi:hypothetical protein